MRHHLLWVTLLWFLLADTSSAATNHSERPHKAKIVSEFCSTERYGSRTVPLRVRFDVSGLYDRRYYCASPDDTQGETPSSSTLTVALEGGSVAHSKQNSIRLPPQQRKPTLVDPTEYANCEAQNGSGEPTQPHMLSEEKREFLVREVIPALIRQAEKLLLAAPYEENIMKPPLNATAQAEAVLLAMRENCPSEPFSALTTERLQMLLFPRSTEESAPFKSLVIFAYAAPNSESFASTIAWSAPCAFATPTEEAVAGDSRLEGAERPLVARINFSPSFIIPQYLAERVRATDAVSRFKLSSSRKADEAAPAASAMSFLRSYVQQVAALTGVPLPASALDSESPGQFDTTNALILYAQYKESYIRYVLHELFHVLGFSPYYLRRYFPHQTPPERTGLGRRNTTNATRDDHNTVDNANESASVNEALLNLIRYTEEFYSCPIRRLVDGIRNGSDDNSGREEEEKEGETLSPTLSENASTPVLMEAATFMYRLFTEDEGGDGTAKGHLERLLRRDDLMSGSPNNNDNYNSHLPKTTYFTLAFLTEFLPFYRLNTIDRAATTVRFGNDSEAADADLRLRSEWGGWGFRAGCGFLLSGGKSQQLTSAYLGEPQLASPPPLCQMSTVVEGSAADASLQPAPRLPIAKTDASVTAHGAKQTVEVSTTTPFGTLHYSVSSFRKPGNGTNARVGDHVRLQWSPHDDLVRDQYFCHDPDAFRCSYDYRYQGHCNTWAAGKPNPKSRSDNSRDARFAAAFSRVRLNRGRSILMNECPVVEYDAVFRADSTPRNSPLADTSEHLYNRLERYGDCTDVYARLPEVSFRHVTGSSKRQSGAQRTSPEDNADFATLLAERGAVGSRCTYVVVPSNDAKAKSSHSLTTCLRHRCVQTPTASVRVEIKVPDELLMEGVFRFSARAVDQAAVRNVSGNNRSDDISRRARINTFATTAAEAETWLRCPLTGEEGVITLSLASSGRAGGTDARVQLRCPSAREFCDVNPDLLVLRSLEEETDDQPRVVGRTVTTDESATNDVSTRPSASALSIFPEYAGTLTLGFFIPHPRMSSANTLNNRYNQYNYVFTLMKRLAQEPVQWQAALDQDLNNIILYSRSRERAAARPPTSGDAGLTKEDIGDSSAATPSTSSQLPLLPLNVGIRQTVGAWRFASTAATTYSVFWVDDAVTVAATRSASTNSSGQGVGVVFQLPISITASNPQEAAAVLMQYSTLVSDVDVPMSSITRQGKRPDTAVTKGVPPHFFNFLLTLLKSKPIVRSNSDMSGQHILESSPLRISLASADAVDTACNKSSPSDARSSSASALFEGGSLPSVELLRVRSPASRDMWSSPLSPWDGSFPLLINSLFLGADNEPSPAPLHSHLALHTRPVLQMRLLLRAQVLDATVSLIDPNIQGDKRALLVAQLEDGVAVAATLDCELLLGLSRHLFRVLSVSASSVRGGQSFQSERATAEEKKADVFDADGAREVTAAAAREFTTQVGSGSSIFFSITVEVSLPAFEAHLLTRSHTSRRKRRRVMNSTSTPPHRNESLVFSTYESTLVRQSFAFLLDRVKHNDLTWANVHQLLTRTLTVSSRSGSSSPLGGSGLHTNDVRTALLSWSLRLPQVVSAPHSAARRGSWRHERLCLSPHFYRDDASNSSRGLSFTMRSDHAGYCLTYFRLYTILFLLTIIALLLLYSVLTL